MLQAQCDSWSGNKIEKETENESRNEFDVNRVGKIGEILELELAFLASWMLHLLFIYCFFAFTFTLRFLNIPHFLPGSSGGPEIWLRSGVWPGVGAPGDVPQHPGH